MSDELVLWMESGTDGYPAGLMDLEKPPGIWWKGVPPFDLSNAVGIVGARHPTPYGQKVGRRLAEGCARAGLTVVSGLAIGIDSAAHLGALDASIGKTLAVIATGVDLVHPKCNQKLASRIEQQGALVSAYPAGTSAAKFRFLERNALIAAISKVLVIVEGAHPTSGALATVARAQELGREVLAVPGMITNPQASAPNALLRDGCAPCLDVSDVLSALSSFNEHRGTRSKPRSQYSKPSVETLMIDEESKILLRLIQGSPMAPEALAEASGIGLRQTLDTLLELELSGLVKRSPMGAFKAG